MNHHWRRIAVPKTEVDLKTLLSCGQSFTWRETSDNVWSNVLQNKLFSVKQTDSELLWCVHHPDKDLESAKCVKSDLTAIKTEPHANTDKPTRKRVGKSGTKPEVSNTCNDDGPTLAKLSKTDNQPNIEDKADVSLEAILRDYFQLDINLGTLYDKWSVADSHFANIAASFPGIRILRQDPTENLFSFICSSNNHISRISSMVLKLAENYGTKLGSVGDIDFYSFPEAADLCKPDVEKKLRELGFGYR